MRKGGWDLIAQQTEVQKLIDIFQSATDSFLAAIGQDPVCYGYDSFH
jgi:hypothetical protein